MTHHVYRSKAAADIHARQQQARQQRPAKRMGQGSQGKAHPQPRTAQDRHKGKH